jgi:hypothetical protein
MKSYPKNGPMCNRRGTPGKSVSEQSLMFGEPVQLPGGVPTSRKYSGVYKPGAADPEGPMPPMGMLNVR